MQFQLGRRGDFRTQRHCLLVTLSALSEDHPGRGNSLWQLGLYGSVAPAGTICLTIPLNQPVTPKTVIVIAGNNNVV